ncbi:MAG TPA: nuclear transport factor 2 family protein [Stellaceae bacterium]|nr:nuclear transport factor 2 family protein [Stellaceae bacterium]
MANAGGEQREHSLDRAAIVEAVQNWGFFRDDGRWDELAQLYAPDGFQSTTWSRGTAADFIAALKRRPKDGPYRGMHIVGASTVAINGARAIAETKMIILLRGKLHDIEVDVSNWGRTYDRFVKSEDAWRIKERVPIYEKDRIDPVDPAATIALDPAEIAKYPAGYRHLAYFQAASGARINLDLPVPGNAIFETLHKEGAAWLAKGG